MAKITVTVEDDGRTPEELTQLATQAIQNALHPPVKEVEKPKPDKDGWCVCKNPNYVYYQFGGGYCTNCGGNTY
jgi:hypothetical protein